MNYSEMPLIIPVLATGYLLTIYLLLMLAERTAKGARYVANQRVSAAGGVSGQDANIPYGKQTEGLLAERLPVGFPSGVSNTRSQTRSVGEATSVR